MSALPSYAACALTLLLALRTPSAHAQEPAAPIESVETRHAKELTLRARERFDAGDYAAALAEYNRAYELLAGDARRAALLNNIAVCHERLFQYDLALQYYERYLREGASDPADREEVEAVIRGLRDLLGKLHITSNVRAEVWIDERLVGHAPGDVTVPAGRRVVKLNASGRQSQQRELEIVARSTQTAHFELEALPEYHGVKSTYFWSGVGLTAGALVAGGVLGLVALKKHHENQKLEREVLHFDDHPKRRLTIAADVCFGAAALFAVGSTVLFFLSDFRGGAEKERAGPRMAQVRVTPSASRDGLRMQLSGVF